MQKHCGICDFRLYLLLPDMKIITLLTADCQPLNKKSTHSKCCAFQTVEKADLQIQLYADAHWASLQIGCFACMIVGTTIGRPQIAMFINTLQRTANAVRFLNYRQMVKKGRKLRSMKYIVIDESRIAMKLCFLGIICSLIPNVPAVVSIQNITVRDSKTKGVILYPSDSAIFPLRRAVMLLVLPQAGHR